MELTMLTVPGCPNAAALEERLTLVLADYPSAVVRRHVADEREAPVCQTQVRHKVRRRLL